jgi:predicted O-methyltransferase YrrM
MKKKFFFRKYTKPAHEHLKRIFGNRTELICGDSGDTLPVYNKPDGLFDAMFIDGGHLYSQARVDIENGASKLVVFQ